MNFLKNLLSKFSIHEANLAPSFEKYVFDTNTKYDLQTFQIIKQHLNIDSNTIDVGAHRGDILQELIKASPKGQHFAFEPIPDLYLGLQTKFKNNARIFPYALGESTDKLPFNLVTSNPAYSGLLKRKYDRPEDDTTIEVEVRRLDDVIPAGVKIDLIKIDVEGAEFGVIKGAVRILNSDKPLIVYEQGLGGSDIYGTDPGLFYDFMEALGYKISLMEYHLLKKAPLDKEEYCKHFWKGYNYYFIAY